MLFASAGSFSKSPASRATYLLKRLLECLVLAYPGNTNDSLEELFPSSFALGVER